jgi:hypothetical protein
MKRHLLVACVGSLLMSASVHAQLPPYPYRAPATTTAAAEETTGEVLVQGRVVNAKGDGKPSFVSRISGMFGSSTPAAPVVIPQGVCVGPGACAACARDCGGGKWDKIVNWWLFRKDRGCYLPCFTPNPYRPPLYNWFPCHETVNADGCGGCAGGCGAGACGTGGCGLGGGTCGGPPITYYYPTPTHPAPSEPRIELRAPTPNSVPGFRFAGAEIPAVTERKRAPIATAVATEDDAPAAWKSTTHTSGYQKP